MFRILFILIFPASLYGNSVILPEQINVGTQGAKGDAIKILASVTAGSSLIALNSSMRISPAEKGKIVMLYGAGPVTVGSNHQDLVGTVVAVIDGTHLKLSVPSGTTGTNLSGILGTDNSRIFQRCVDRAHGSNTVIKIPAGQYLMIPKDLLNPMYQMKRNSETHAAVVINKGGITFQGVNPTTTILTACGAWQLKGQYVSRGMLFSCHGPISRPELPLVFENLTFDGGVTEGRISYRGFPARTTDGSGWDMTHGAVIDRGTEPLHSFKAFRNCIFQHWRGEILKGVSGAMHGFIEVKNTDFHDGNASAFNFDVAHHIDRCTFDHLDMAMEFYEGRMDRPSVFENSSVSDVRADLVIVGALTNHASPLYTIRNNNLQGDQFGIFLNPAKNVLIESNRFEGQGFCIGNGAGAQGTDHCHDIIIRGNLATNTDVFFLVQCGYENRMENILITGNCVAGKGWLGGGWGYSTNVFFSNNVATNGANGFQGERLTGQWFYDDPSNRYSPSPAYCYTSSISTITYANGGRQQTFPYLSNSIFMVDDSKPDKIPVGAVIKIGCNEKNPKKVPIYLSSTQTNRDPEVLLNPGSTITCNWKEGRWHPVNDAVNSGGNR